MMPPRDDINYKTTYAPDGTEQMNGPGGGQTFNDIFGRYLRRLSAPQVQSTAPPKEMLGMHVAANRTAPMAHMGAPKKEAAFVTVWRKRMPGLLGGGEIEASPGEMGAYQVQVPAR